MYKKIIGLLLFSFIMYGVNAQDFRIKVIDGNNNQIAILIPDASNSFEYTYCRNLNYSFLPIDLNGNPINSRIKIKTSADSIVIESSCSAGFFPVLIEYQNIDSVGFKPLDYFDAVESLCGSGSHKLKKEHFSFDINKINTDEHFTLKIYRNPNVVFNNVSPSLTSIYNVTNNNVISFNDIASCYEIKFSNINLSYFDGVGNIKTVRISSQFYLKKDGIDGNINPNNIIRNGDYGIGTYRVYYSDNCSDNSSYFFTIIIENLPNASTGTQDLYSSTLVSEIQPVCDFLDTNADVLEVEIPFNPDISFTNFTIPSSVKIKFYNNYYRTYEKFINLDYSSDSSDEQRFEILNSSGTIYNPLDSDTYPHTIKLIFKLSSLFAGTNTNLFQTIHNGTIYLESTNFELSCVLDYKYYPIKKIYLKKQYITPVKQNILLNEFTNGSNMDGDDTTNGNELTTKSILHQFKNKQITKIKFSSPIDILEYDAKYSVKMYTLPYNMEPDENTNWGPELTIDDNLLDTWFNWEENGSTENFNRRKFYFDIFYLGDDCVGNSEPFAKKILFDYGIFDVPKLEEVALIEICDDDIANGKIDLSLFIENTAGWNKIIIYNSQFGDDEIDGNLVSVPTNTSSPSNTYYVAQQGPLLDDYFWGRYPNLLNLETVSAKRIEVTIEYNCCPDPIDLSEVTGQALDTSVTLNWLPQGNENQWQIEYGFHGFQQGNGIFVTAHSNTFTVNGLVPANAYDFYVRAICGSDETSGWIGPVKITTECSNCTSFKPQVEKKYVLSAWVKEDHTIVTTTTFTVNTNFVKEMLNQLVIDYQANGFIINGSSNAGLENLKNTEELYGDLNTTAAIYDFSYIEYRRVGKFQFRFGPSEPLQFFSVKSSFLNTADAPPFGIITTVSYDETLLDQTAFSLEVAFIDGLGNINIQNKIYNFGDNTYKSTITTTNSNQVMNYINSYVKILFFDSTYALVGNPNQVDCFATGNIIDGWQRIQKEFTIPANTVKLNIELVNNFSSDVYFDDIRVFPAEGNMKSFVYNQKSQKLMAELDENNYATFYEYDNEGGLIRVKKETEKGIFTIQETRSGNIKKSQN